MCGKLESSIRILCTESRVEQTSFSYEREGQSGVRKTSAALWFCFCIHILTFQETLSDLLLVSLPRSFDLFKVIITLSYESKVSESKSTINIGPVLPWSMILGGLRKLP